MSDGTQAGLFLALAVVGLLVIALTPDDTWLGRALSALGDSSGEVARKEEEDRDDR